MSVHERSSFSSFTVETTSLPQEAHSAELQEGKHVSTQGGHDFSANVPKSGETHKAEKSFTDARLDVQQEVASKPRRAVNIAVGAAATFVETLASKVSQVGARLLQFGKKLATEKGREDVKSQMSQGFKDIKTKAGKLRDAAVDKFTEVKEALPGRVREIKDNAPEALKTAFKKVNTATTSFFKKLGSAEGRKELTRGVKDAAIYFKDKSIAVFESGSQKMKDGVADLKSRLEPKLEAYETKGGQITKDAGDKLGELKQDAGEKLNEMKREAGDKLGELKRSTGEKLGGIREVFKTKWEALTSSKDKTKAVASQNPAISSHSVDRSSLKATLPIFQKSTSKDYTDLLDIIQSKGSDYKLSFSEKDKSIQVRENKGPLSSISVDKKSRAAMKEMLKTAASEVEKDPLSALELLNKMQSTHWGRQVLRASASNRANFEEVQQAALKQCCNQSGGTFASLLSQVTKEELFASGSHSGKSTYAKNCPHLNELIQASTNMSNSVADRIVSKANFKERVKTMEMYIRLADMADQRGDFMTSQSVLAGLSLAHVARLKKTKEALPKDAQAMLERLQAKQGSPSLETAPLERAAMLKYPGNEQGLPVIPSIAMAFLSPLTFASDKQDPLKDSLRNLNWSNDFIDQALQDISQSGNPLSLEASITQIERQISDVQKQIDNTTSSTLKLSFKKQDLEAQLKEAKDVRDFMVHIRMSDKVNMPARLKSLQEKAVDLEKRAKTEEEPVKKKELSTRLTDVKAEIEQFEKFQKRLETLSKDEPLDARANIASLLNKFKESNDAAIKNYQIGIEKYQKELNTLADEFATLATPLREYPSTKREDAQAWYTYSAPVPDSQIPEGKNKDSFFEDYYYKLSLKNEPREAARKSA
ncbi:RasGEF domain-containing protein [Candidatus Protochlamydia phocaeensis]|uniref:RasGEF domain-containing protein n=1 Tax=Candidatus Protochlamydia phocaeensis TaxID=1414722 RepID=UPI0008393AE7|nr:RasGEF domain-containing protein [Candidatus Protochlamydia phocaeensis]